MLRQHRASQKADIYDGRIEGKDGVGIEQMLPFTYGLSHAYGKVHYDLDEKLSDIDYLNSAMSDIFESVYHKIADGYELQKEVRFSVICSNKPDHYELQLENDQKLRFTLIPLSFGKDIGVELSELEFDDVLGLPVRFSDKIKFYESQ